MNPELNNALQQLQHEIDNSQNMDDATREKMSGLQTDIRAALDDPNHHRTLRERLDDAVSTLEADHPALTAAISSVVNLLSNMGI